MELLTLNVVGMSCEHCVSAIKSALVNLPGVKNVEVNLADATVQVSVDTAQTTRKQIKKTIEHTGYNIV